MPQIRKAPLIMGDYSALRGRILEFALSTKQKDAAKRFVAALGKMEKLVLENLSGAFIRTDCTELEVLESGLMTLTDIALQPDLLWTKEGHEYGSGVVTPTLFARLYAAEPDFTLAVLAFIRRKWMPSRHSKAMRLYHFMANAGNFYIEHPQRHKKLCMIWNLQDGEIAAAFEKSSGGQCVSTDDVAKARTQVAKDVKHGLAVAERLGLKINPTDYLHGVKAEAFC